MDSLDQCIVNACKNSWDKSYLAGTPNKDNCSGFVQSVAAELGVPMPRGNANAMVDGLEQSWTKLASGAEAAQKAAQGFLVIAGLKGRTYGHVAVVISGPLYRQKYPMCWCGSIAGAVGQSQGLKSVGQVWNRTDRDRLNYYVYSWPVAACPGPVDSGRAANEPDSFAARFPRASRLHSPAPSPPACALRPPHSARMLRQNGARGFSGPRMNIFQLE